MFLIDGKVNVSQFVADSKQSRFVKKWRQMEQRARLRGDLVVSQVSLEGTIDKRRYNILPVDITGMIGFLFCIGFCSEYCICKKKCPWKKNSWQRVWYYLEVGINQDFLDIKWIYWSWGQDQRIEENKKFVYTLITMEVRPKSQWVKL